MRVLIAEDYSDIRELLTTALELQGWEVIAAQDGREALHFYHKLIDENRYFDLLLLDVRMPRLGGFPVGLNVRNLERDGGVPRAVHIYFTGDTDLLEPDDLIKSLFADAYIHKPIDMDTLIETINELRGKQ